MRALALLVFATLVAAGCGSSPDQVATESGSPAVVEDPTAEPGTAPTAVPTGEPTPTSAPDDSTKLAQLVLTAAELPDWSAGGEGPFEPEPQENNTDCVDLDDYLLITHLGGWESTFDTEGLGLRSSAQQFDSVEHATAFMATVDTLPYSCTVIGEDGTNVAWVEPVQVPTALDQSAGLVIGGDNGMVMMAFHRLGAVVAGIEVEGDVDIWNQFEVVAGVLAVKLRKVAGEAPLPEPTPAGPLPTASPTSGPTPTPIPTSRPIWMDSPLAVAVLDDGDLGAGWEREFVNWREAAPPDPEENIEGCDVDTPPTLEGVEAEFFDRGSDQVIEQILSRGSPADVRATVQAFRALGECGAVQEDDWSYSVEPRDPPALDADDVIALDISIELEAQNPRRIMRILMASYDDVLVSFSAYTFSETAEVTVPWERLAELVELAATRLEK